MCTRCQVILVDVHMHVQREQLLAYRDRSCVKVQAHIHSVQPCAASAQAVQDSRTAPKPYCLCQRVAATHTNAYQPPQPLPLLMLPRQDAVQHAASTLTVLCPCRAVTVPQISYLPPAAAASALAVQRFWLLLLLLLLAVLQSVATPPMPLSTAPGHPDLPARLPTAQAGPLCPSPAEPAGHDYTRHVDMMEF